MATSTNQYPIETLHDRYIFLKYAPDGTRFWATSALLKFGKESFYTLSSMVTDRGSNIYTVGLERYFISKASGSFSPVYQLITAKVNPDGNLLWFESETTSKPNIAYQSNIIVSDNENIYVTGVTTNNGIRTVKYVQCPSQANAFRTGNNAVNNTASAEIKLYSTDVLMQPVIANENEATSEIPTVNQHFTHEFVSMYPNPNDGNFYVNYSLSGKEQCEFAIYEPTGKMVYNVEIKTGKNTVIVNSNTLSKGVYYYKVFSGKRIVKTDKIVIIK